ncbi:hypothetical protein HK102_009841 [Quaeritorhiza haematococci]|nr:hypothetical protein HK102_009841 [Quaeritorhiza haematococci]
MEPSSVKNEWVGQNVVEKWTFDMLYCMLQQNELPNLASTILLVLEDIQVLQFTLSDQFRIRNAPQWLSLILNPTNFTQGDYTRHLTMWKIAIALTGVLIILVLLDDLGCDYHINRLIVDPREECWTGQNAPYFYASIAALLLFIPYTVITMSVFFTFDPATESHHARNPIALFDPIYIIVRMILVICFKLLPRESVFDGILLVAGNAYLLHLQLTTQPFYHDFFNKLRAGFAAGYFASVWTQKVILANVYNRLKAMEPAGKAAADTTKVEPQRKMSIIQSTESSESRESNSSNPNSNSNPTAIHIPRRATIAKLDDIISTKTVNSAEKIFSRISDVEMACRFIKRNQSSEAISLVAEIFQEGLKQYPRSACLNLIFSRYIVAYFHEYGARKLSKAFTMEKRLNTRYELALEYLQRAKTLKPSAITRFFIFIQDRLLEQAMKTMELNTSDVDLSSYFEFQTILRGARKYHLQALAEIRAFYYHLKSNRNDPSYIERISMAAEEANDCFEKLIKRYPNSRILHQMYARFVLTVRYNPELAKKLLRAADEMEAIEDPPSASVMRGDTSMGENATDKAPDIPRQNSAEGSMRQSASLMRLRKPISLLSLHSIKQNPLSTRAAAEGNKSPQTQAKVATPPSPLRNQTATLFLKDARIDDEASPIREERAIRFANVRPKYTEASQSQPNLPYARQNPGGMRASIPDMVGGNGNATQSYHNLDENDLMRIERAPISDSSESDRVTKYRLSKKRQMSSMLKAPLKRFAKLQLFVLACFIMFVSLGFGVSLFVFESIKKSNVDFAMSGYLVHKIVELGHHVRLLEVAVNYNDTDMYNAEKETMEQVIYAMRDEVLPRLVPISEESPRVPVRVRLVPQHSPHLVQESFYDSVAKMVDLIELALQQEEHGVESHHIPYVFDNVVDISEYIREHVRDVEAKYRFQANLDSGILLVLFGCLVVIAILWGAILFRGVLKKSQANEVRFIKPLSYVPKRDLVTMLTDVEEYIENITQELILHEDNGRDVTPAIDLSYLRKDTGLRYNKTEIIYVLAMISLTLLATIVFVLPVWRRLAIVDMLPAINLAADQSLYVQSVALLQTEILMDEGTITERFDAEMRLRHYISLLNDLHQSFQQAAGMKLTSILNVTVSSGICKRSNASECEPENRYPPYRPEFGYTQTLVLQPLNSLMQHFIYEASVFLEEHSVDETYVPSADMSGFFTNNHWIMCWGLVRDILEGIEKVEDAVYDSIIRENDKSSQIITGFFVSTVVLSFFFYIFLFRRFMHRKLSQANTVLDLLFMLPDNVLDSKPEIKNFFETLGLSEDKEQA